MKFRARVIDERRSMSWLVLDADDEEHVHRLLGQKNCRALSVTRDSATWLKRPAARRFPVLLFTQELLALLEAGLSIIEAIDALLEKEPQEEVRAVLQSLQSNLRSGAKFSESLRSVADTIPVLLVGMVQASERTGSLPQALARYVEYRQRIDQVRGRLISAAIYPAILVIAGFSVAMFLLAYVVPRFASVYRGSGRELPWASELLLGWGRLVHDHAGQVFLVTVLSLLAVAWWLVSFGGVAKLAQAVRRMPGVGERLHLLEVSRLCLTLGLLLEGGIGMLQALQMAGSVLSPGSRSALERVTALVAEGKPLSEALQSQGLATSISTRLARVGESSGQLGAMLRRAAHFHEGETARWLERFTKAFEPALMAAIGVVIGGIVLLLYMPIFDLAGTLP